jgi:hypothetical protein
MDRQCAGLFQQRECYLRYVVLNDTSKKDRQGQRTKGTVAILIAVVVGDGRLDIEGTELIPSNRFSLCKKHVCKDVAYNGMVIWLTGCTGMTFICLSRYHSNTYHQLALEWGICDYCEAPWKPVVSGLAMRLPRRIVTQQGIAPVSFLLS